MNQDDRIKLLKLAKSHPEVQQELLSMCESDILFWFDTFCWTFNPRVKPAHMPFNLWQFQIPMVETIRDCILDGENLLIEKSRDMGVSWVVLMCFQWFWLFREGTDLLVCSKKEDNVDKKGDKSTLFEKLRYNLSFMPDWMIPALNKFQDSHMKLVHPVNGNVIVGESSNPDTGRSGRYTAVLLDEMAFHPYGEAAFTSVSQSSDCIIMPSTPNGKANWFYKLRKNTGIDWVEMERLA